MNTKLSKILSDALTYRGRSLVVIASILIGVFGVSSLVGMGDILLRELLRGLNPDEIAMSRVYVTSTGGMLSRAANEAFLNALSAEPGIEQVEAVAIYPVKWSETPANVIAFSQPFDQVSIEPVRRIVEGRYPASGEIAVEQRFAEAYNIRLGDRLRIQQQANAGSVAMQVIRRLEGIAVPEREWTVVGILFDPYTRISTLKGEPIQPQNSLYATYDDAQSMAGFTGYSAIYAQYGAVGAARDSLKSLSRAVAQNTPYIPVFSFVEDPHSSYAVRGASTILSIMNVLGIIAMLVSDFLVTNVITTMVVEQQRQIGVLKSLGATRRDVFVIYCGIALLYGVIGTIPGLLLSVPVAYSMADALSSGAGVVITEFSVSATGLVLGAIMGLAVPVLAAFIPSLNATRVTILDAMTNLGISSNWGKSRLSRFIGRLPLPITIRQAVSNIVQKRQRLMLTLTTLTLAIAAFMGISGYFSSLTDAVATLNTRSSTHIAVRFAQGQQFEQVQQLIESQIPEVRRIHPGYSVNVDLEGYISTSGFTLGTNQIVAQGIDLENPPMRLELSAGRLTSAGAVISAGLASKLGVTLGDPLNMVIGENAATYPVVGIEDNGADALYFDWRTLADVARFRTWDQTPLVNSVFIELNAIELNAPNDAAAIDSQIDTLTRYLDSNGIMAVYTNQPEATEESIRLISLLGTVFNMASLVMGLVGAIGLFSALTMAVFERQREIGIMRSIGAGSGTIIVQFVVEGVVIGVLAWAVGVPLSVVLASGLDGILSALANNLEFAYPVGVVITGLIGMVVLSLTASVLPSVSASRKTVSDILRYA